MERLVAALGSLLRAAKDRKHRPTGRNRPSRHLVAVVVAVALLVASCASSPAQPGSTTAIEDPPSSAVVPEPDADAVRRGGALYGQYCAACHGADLRGESNWKTPKADGSYPAPPHDSTGHTWHHSDQLLLKIVRDGSAAPWSTMPAFGDLLTDEEIVWILDFLKSHWGPQEREIQWGITQRHPASNS